jgi:hypothetical protein
MRPRSSSTKARGICSRAASVSSENLGHSAENEQHAPQVLHAAAVGPADRPDEAIT